MRKRLLFHLFLGCFVLSTISLRSFAYNPGNNLAFAYPSTLLTNTDLSFEEFAKLTGRKTGLFNRILFTVFKGKVKKELRKKTGIMQDLPDPYRKRRSTVMRILSWIIGIILVAMLIVALVFSGVGKK